MAQPDPAGKDAVSASTPASPHPYSRVLQWLFGGIVSRMAVDEEALKSLREAARRKTIVYVMPSASVVDFLLMNMLAIRHQLPLACLANTTLIRLMRKCSTPTPSRWNLLRSAFKPRSLRVRDECRQIVSELQDGHSATLFLKTPGLLSKSVRWNVLVWEELIRAERKEKIQSLLVPIAFIWSRDPGRIGRSLWDIIFGDTNAPGFLRKAFIFLRHYRHVQIKIGQPVDIRTSLAEIAPARDEILAKKLRRTLSSYLFRERRLLLGPPIRDRRRVIRTLLKDPDLTRLISSVARREKKTEAEVWRRAERILRELISDYSQTALAISSWVFRWLWNRLYKPLNVHWEGFEELKTIMKDYPVILTPSHKSHMDYLLVSGLLYENGVMPPHIAAGINLAFWPMGLIFRKTGAFFIRRGITGDLLYVRLLALYVRWLIRTGYSQEFFIEGGRTRTGKLIFPKHGLLALQVDAFLDGAGRDLYVAPISITYEKVPEEASYYEELSGKEKKKENVWSLWSSRKLLKRSHGSAYIRFAKPMSLYDYFDVSSNAKISTKIRRAKTLELATGIVRDIASQTVVTTSALTSLAMLAQREQGIEETALQERVTELSSYVQNMNIPHSPEAGEPAKHMNWVLKFFFNNAWISIGEGQPPHRLIVIREDRRLSLDFYKNTILHFFLAPALAATTLEYGHGENTQLDDMNFLRDLFAHEFFFHEKDDANALLSTGRSWVERTGRRPLRILYSGLVRNYLESYDLTIQIVTKYGLHEPHLDAIRMQRALAFGHRLYATGEITHQEAISAANVRSALSYLYERELLKDRDDLENWHTQLKRLCGQ